MSIAGTTARHRGQELGPPPPPPKGNVMSSDLLRPRRVEYGV